MSGSRDSNPESLVPKTSMLAVTPHPDYRMILAQRVVINNTEKLLVTSIELELARKFVECEDLTKNLIRVYYLCEWRVTIGNLFSHEHPAKRPPLVVFLFPEVYSLILQK